MASEVEHDLLRMYLSKKHYDCTFLVGKPGEKWGSQLFRCHKLVMQAASEVFEAMFFGRGEFKETLSGPEDQIKLDNVQPEAFDFAMRFIYGERAGFRNNLLATKVYMFAHQWQIKSLMAAVDKHLKDLSPDWLCQVYEMYKFLNADEKQRKVFELMKTNVKTMMVSRTWEEAKEETVIDILKSENLPVLNESLLFEGLVNWAGSQVADDSAGRRRGGQNWSGAMRVKMKECIGLIRFRTMSGRDFAGLTTSRTRKLLFTEQEKLAILTSITLGEADLMPAGFSKNAQPRVKLSNPFFFNWDAEFGGEEEDIGEDYSHSSYFHANHAREDRFLVGVNLQCFHLEQNEDKSLNVKCLVKKAGSDEILAEGCHKGTITQSHLRHYLPIEPSVFLVPNVMYVVTNHYTNVEEGIVTTVDYSKIECAYTRDGVTLANLLDGFPSLFDMYGFALTKAL